VLSTTKRLPDSAIETVFSRLLELEPHAPVVAISASGLFMPMPVEVPLGEHPVITGHRSALDLVVPADRTKVIEAWREAALQGAVHLQVTLLADPDQTALLHFLDLTNRYGVYIGVFGGYAGELSGELGAAGPLKPRFFAAHKDPLAVTLEVDDAVLAVLGWRPHQIVGRRSLEFVHPADHERAIANWMDMLNAPGGGRRVRFRHRHADGSWVWLEVTNHNLIDNPDAGYVLAEMIDISDEMAAQQALAANEQLLRRLTESLPVGVLQIDRDRQVVYRNKLLSRIAGRRGTPRTVDSQLANVAPADRPALTDALTAVLANGQDRDLEVSIGHRAGPRRCSIQLRALTGGGGDVTGAVLCILDITEDAKLREILRERANFDSLTRCHNRAATLAALRRVLALEPEGSGIGVIFLDLDHFKQVNDELGHAAGDRLLRHVADCLTDSAREGDVVGRIGGDEFLVVCPGLDSALDASRLAERFATSLEATVRLAGHEYRPRASIGVAWARPGEDADAIIARADEAMYGVKARGRGGERPGVIAAKAINTDSHEVA
jgi:diguanylate cyclase (GGDEF)-like protein/PAS domain S-box-containing protein